jgi:cytochrome bd-type quinol oxidase subunit 2
VSTKLFRYKLVGSSAFLIIVAIIIAVCVITPVKNDTSPNATPHRAAMAFLGCVVVSFLLGAMLAAIAIRAIRNRDIMIIIGMVAFVALILSLLILDAAFAFKGGGQAMHTVSILLFCCSFAEFAATILAITSMFPYPKKNDEISSLQVIDSKAIDQKTGC